jgi:hypothetical protein
MAILDLQGLEAPAERNGGHGGASTLSLLSCVSTASVVLCV